MQQYIPHIVTVLAGCIFAAVGCGIWLSEKKKKAVCTAEVIGVVKSTGAMFTYKKGKKRMSYTPTYAYSVEGVEYVQQSSKSSSKCRFSEGQEIPLFYDPAKPDRYYLPEEATHLAILLLLIGVGVLLMVAPLYSLFMQ